MEITYYSIRSHRLSEIEQFEMAARLAGLWRDGEVQIIASQVKCEWWITPVWQFQEHKNERQWERLTAYARKLANRDMVSRSNEGDDNDTA